MVAPAAAPPATPPAPAVAAPAAIWLVTLWATAVQAMVPIAASPIAPPICWPTLNRLDATPASWGATCETTVRVIGTNIRPMPTLTSSMPGSRLGQ